MKTKLQQQRAKRKRQIRKRQQQVEARLQSTPTGRQSPELQASNIHYEISERQQAISCGDGTMVTTTGQCKPGMDINYKGQWGYHPLMISLANTPPNCRTRGRV